MTKKKLRPSILTTATLLALCLSGSPSVHADPDRPFAPLGDPTGHMDTNGDGLVSADEFNPPGIMLDRLDADKDGAITRSELDAHIAAMKAEMAERQADMFERIEANFTASDADGDGMVTQAEAQAAAFARIDTDGDGYLSREEFRSHRPDHPRGHAPSPRHPGKHPLRNSEGS
ncbi:MAG: EF-hand domain-containing protein [Proteobacteria bacterium]|nr:EF-hand domain-containing protein [Pseudomonadota bacterium]